ncbi:MAG TPA: signal peptidase I [Patescibacteria group bacterium]|nr:signal peptidase I [Patescibacteria group bacterium]
MRKILSKINFRLIGRVFYGLVLAIFLVVAGVMALSAFKIPNGIKAFTVQSGSMSPKVSTGSLVFVAPQKEYKVGDVITFKTEAEKEEENPKYTTTHRIIKFEEREEGKVFITKGDANDAQDWMGVNPGLVIGRVIFHIPLIGYPVSFAKTRDGFVVLVVIPATLIIYSELVTIKNEALRLVRERKQRKLTAKEKIEEKIGEEIIAAEKGVAKVLKSAKSKV